MSLPRSSRYSFPTSAYRNSEMRERRSVATVAGGAAVAASGAGTTAVLTATGALRIVAGKSAEAPQSEGQGPWDWGEAQGLGLGLGQGQGLGLGQAQGLRLGLETRVGSGAVLACGGGVFVAAGCDALSAVPVSASVSASARVPQRRALAAHAAAACVAPAAACAAVALADASVVLFAAAAAGLPELRRFAVARDAAVTRKPVLSSLSFSACDSLLASTARDNVVRLFDPRADSVSVASSLPIHTGSTASKPSKIFWLQRSLDYLLLSTGLAPRSLDRECALWDARSLREPVFVNKLDGSSNGQIISLYDADSSLLFVTGKGDTTIRTFEISSSALTPFSQAPFVLSRPVIDACLLGDKRSLDVMDCEIARIMVLQSPNSAMSASSTAECSLVPVSFNVARQFKSNFQIDLFPDTIVQKQTLTAEQWMSGENAPLVKVTVDPNTPASTTVCELRLLSKIVPYQPEPQPLSPSLNPTTSSSTSSSSLDDRFSNNGSRPNSPGPASIRSRPNSFVASRSVADSAVSIDFKAALANRPSTPSRLSLPPVVADVTPTAVSEDAVLRPEKTVASPTGPGSAVDDAAQQMIESILVRVLDAKLDEFKTAPPAAAPPNADDGAATAAANREAENNSNSLLVTVVEKLDALTDRLTQVEAAISATVVAAAEKQAQAASAAASAAAASAASAAATTAVEASIFPRMDQLAARIDAARVAASAAYVEHAAALRDAAAAVPAAAKETSDALFAGLAARLDAAVRDAAARAEGAVAAAAAAGAAEARRVEAVVREVGEYVREAGARAVAGAADAAADAAVHGALAAQQAQAAAAAVQAAAKKGKILQVPNMGITTQLSKLKEMAINNIVKDGNGSVGGSSSPVPHVSSAGGEGGGDSKRSSVMSARAAVAAASAAGGRSSVVESTRSMTSMSETVGEIEEEEEEGEEQEDANMKAASLHVGYGAEEIADEVRAWRLEH